MKDSQRKSDITKIGDKYIKANNERFSTMSILVAVFA